MRVLIIITTLILFTGCAVTTIKEVTYKSVASSPDINIPIENKIVVLADDSVSERHVPKAIEMLNQLGFQDVYTEQSALDSEIEPDTSVILAFTKNGSRTGVAISSATRSSSGGASKSGYTSGATGGGTRGTSLGASGPSVIRDLSRFSALWYDIKNEKILEQNIITAATPLTCDDLKVQEYLVEQFFMRFGLKKSPQSRNKVNYDCGKSE